MVQTVAAAPGNNVARITLDVPSDHLSEVLKRLGYNGAVKATGRVSVPLDDHKSSKVTLCTMKIEIISRCCNLLCDKADRAAKNTLKNYCTGCNIAVYCSNKCLRLDWKNAHQYVCKGSHPKPQSVKTVATVTAVSAPAVAPAPPAAPAAKPQPVKAEVSATAVSAPAAASVQFQSTSAVASSTSATTSAPSELGDDFEVVHSSS